ncbi:MAG: double-strand break repair helicase HerA and related ATPase, partial [Acidobacteriota bacterium]|nr:double-strand break repair helicase HerA and related ATPase [Acidobacteriota bacterium]
MTTFDDSFRSAYGFDAPGIEVGHALHDGKPQGTLPIRIPLRMMNRHGLIAGSTGTGKTRTLQLLA